MWQLIENSNHLAIFLIIGSNTITVFVDANELIRCCTNGRQYFEQTSTCNNIRLDETKVSCILTASICCINTLMEQSCGNGVKKAKQENYCSSNTDQIDGVIHKECCECCLLAKELLLERKNCTPPDGVNWACLRSFHQCCSQNMRSEFDLQIPTYENFVSTGDGCTRAKCEHFCKNRGSAGVECSCRAGYELASDGYSCIDIDECLLLADDCSESQRCLNTPGSFKCIRTLSCGTGYALDSDTEQCIDVDECSLGSHDCGPSYHCRNTQGSYRCDPKKCDDSELMNPRTGECTKIDCPVGYKPIRGRCEDVNECQMPGQCRNFEECINTPGSFQCQDRTNLCANGYRMDRDTGFCIDINECTEGSHLCGDKQCINLLGSYKCRCSAGFEFNETTKRCEDVDECKKFKGHVCSLHATCENTFGSFRCHCQDGFIIASDARSCEGLSKVTDLITTHSSIANATIPTFDIADIDECRLGIARCAQKCINIPGSYQCVCERGYRLGADGITCEDIDECTLWAGSGDDLCMGTCTNTPGSYKCNCPSGYEIEEDGRTCKDIDECSLGKCQGNDQICVNTLGSFKCHIIRCPPNYIHDKNYKNRCNRLNHLCDSLTQEECKNHAVRISWEFTSIPRQEPISSRRTSITLFTIRGPLSSSSSVQFELKLKSAIPEKNHVIPAVRSNFLLQKSGERNGAIIALRDSLDGPQEITLELILRLSTNGVFQSKYVAILVINVSSDRRQRITSLSENLNWKDDYLTVYLCFLTMIDLFDLFGFWVFFSLSYFTDQF
ncbi:unnamed protein product [Thelazia callipaeda]|uniref:Fibulin-1 n=1 Tax=Thelazia callipaeda TaxID=103827 RepID=A0A0N5D6I9_THECL|nr:unnamed protein product [Thelazia callipaeda]